MRHLFTSNVTSSARLASTLPVLAVLGWVAVRLLDIVANLPR